jgi:hypothetical protein
VTDSAHRDPSPHERIASYVVLDGGDQWGFVILPSAYRHGIVDDAMLHAVSHHVKLFDVGQGMTMVIGPAPDAQLLEVGLAVWHDDIAIIHTMPARSRFLPFLK